MPQRVFRGSELICAATGGAFGAGARLLLDELYSGPRHDFVVSLIAVSVSGLLLGALPTGGYRRSTWRWFALGFCSGLGALSVAVVVATTSTHVWMSVAYLVATVFVATGAIATGRLTARLGAR
ncbi:hypothetical protein [Gordonia rubripertincta]|uniref:Fluoride ion transporter CrcB n=1 Tax=Gordonia rubripertincta TaxID=36822 RepID=A0ABT4N0I3_GORRU|nr:hypothetical protein [Gordonia rubripertincta]MCZ4551801.1 hypothetical protein [Gordonia rubripertincta]